MAAPIGPGDWVQALRDVEHVYGGRIVGEGVYCVLCINQGVSLSDGVWTEGLVLTDPATQSKTDLGEWHGWLPHHFRPLGGNAKTLTAPPQRITEAA